MDTKPDSRAESVQNRIIAAGRDLFFEIGFSRVTTDRLAKEARVSKASLYKYFPSMSAVLVAVVEQQGDSFETGLPMEPESMDELEEALSKYGTALLQFLNQPEILQFCYLMHEEAREHPEVASVFFKAAYGRSLRNLQSMFEHGKKCGYFSNDLSSSELAEVLIGMWENVKWTKALMGVSKKPFPNPAAWSRKCVRALLAGSRDETQ